MRRLIERIARFVLDLVAEPEPLKEAPKPLDEFKDFVAKKHCQRPCPEPVLDPSAIRKVARQLDLLADRLVDPFGGIRNLDPILDSAWSGMTIRDMDKFRTIIADLRKASAEKAERAEKALTEKLGDLPDPEQLEQWRQIVEEAQHDKDFKICVNRIKKPAIAD